MAYRKVGSGPVLVLVHGVLCDYRCWGSQTKALSNDFQVVAVSLRHFYPEKWDGKGTHFTVAQHAKDLGAFISRLGEGPVLLVGHSYGAHVAYEVARARPALVRKLVLAEAPIDSLNQMPDPDVGKVRKQRATDLAKRFEAGEIDGGLMAAINAINGPGAWERVPEPARSVVRDNAWTVVGLGLQDSPAASCADFGSLRMPVLLVMGEESTPRFKRIVQEQGACLPQATVVRIPKAGHGSPYQNPQAFNAELLAFFAR